jgi:hypothetical protein
MRGIHLLMRPEDSRIHSGRSQFSARRGAAARAAAGAAGGTDSDRILSR